MKKKGLIITILLICIIAVVSISAWYIYNETIMKKETKEENENKVENVVNELEMNNENNVASEEEKDEIENYLNKILDQGQRIVEFEDINEASKEWIYAPLNRYIERDEYDYYASEEEIEKALLELYGDDLKYDIRKDTDESDEMVVPKFNEEKGEYVFSPHGIEMFDQYAVDNIEKIDNLTYKVTVTEYTISLFGGSEEDSSSKITVGTRDTDDKVKEIFKVDSNEATDLKYYNQNDIIVNKVKENKDQFNSYSITIEENEDGLLNVKSIKKIDE